MSTAEQRVTYHFGDFRLDPAERQLWRGEERVDLSARYFDALVLLVRERGQLVEKDRFFAEVWGDVVVSDSALTQCVKDIRNRLGDDASSPRYVETVPRYGYRFIGRVETVASGGAAVESTPASLSADASLAVGPHPTDREALTNGQHKEPALAPERAEIFRSVPDAILAPGAAPAPGVAPALDAAIETPQGPFTLQAAGLWVGAGALGGGFAGILGGLLYGSALAYSPAAGLGTASILVVLLSLNVLMGLVGGAGVSGGMAAVGWVRSRSPGWSVGGAALGGLVVGGGVKLLGVDAFNLFFGRAPAGITGGLEGAALGAAIALGARLGGRVGAPSWWPAVGAGVVCAVAGGLIAVSGGHLMGGSLDLLGRSFSGSRLQLDALGQLFGEVHFGQTAQVVLSSVEGFVFGTCVAGALSRARLVLPAHSRSS